MQEELGTGFENLMDESEVITRKQAKEQKKQFKRFENYAPEDLDTGLSHNQKTTLRKKRQSVGSARG